MQTTLVTGGAEFIGSPIVHKILSLGHKVIVRETLADISKIKSQCIWKPKVNIVEWISKQL